MLDVGRSMFDVYFFSVPPEQKQLSAYGMLFSNRRFLAVSFVF
jgi:hypothetical protein